MLYNMKTLLTLFSLFLLLQAHPTQAVTTDVPVEHLRDCILNNDSGGCRSLLTTASYSLFDRFASYKLLVCVPSNWTVESQKRQGNATILTVSIPASNRSRYITKLVYQGTKLDLPASLRLGMGEKWENKIKFSEQIYLMMKQNLGAKLTCDTISSIVEPKT